VNADATSNAADVSDLVGALGGIDSPLPSWSTDLNRSGVITPADILEAVDLLIGAGSLPPYNGISLPK
jgi:hypothetical protein